MCISRAYFFFGSEYLTGFLSICYAAFSDISYFLFWFVSRLQTPSHSTPSPQIFTSVQNCCMLNSVSLRLSFWEKERRKKNLASLLKINLKNKICCQYLFCTFRTVYVLRQLFNISIRVILPCIYSHSTVPINILTAGIVSSGAVKGAGSATLIRFPETFQSYDSFVIPLP